MLKQIVTTLLGLLLLSGCTDGFRGYFQKSANNKLVDTKGFAGGKRKPLYNKKYISIAKKNIVEENFDDDEDLEDIDDEKINPTIRNRKMYLKMIKRDAERSKRRKLKDHQDDYDDYDQKYPSLNKANNKLRETNNSDKEEKLQKELSQIKSMLNETKKELAKYNCQAPQNVNDASLEDLKQTIPQNNHEQRSVINKTKSTRKLENKSGLKKKFLNEDDDTNTTTNNSTIDNSIKRHDRVNTIIKNNDTNTDSDTSGINDDLEGHQKERHPAHAI